MPKKKIIFILLSLLVLLLLVFIISENRKGSFEKLMWNCNRECVFRGYNRGECLSAGSANPNTCEEKGGINITDRDDPIPHCNFEAIGIWDVCCCFK